METVAIRLCAVVFAAMAMFAIPTPADCAYCPSYRCFGPCGGDCVCISSPGEMSGQCFGVEAAQRLVARGWRVVP